MRRAAARISAVSETARLDAEVLLTGATGKPRTHFFAWPERKLEPGELAEFTHLVERRCAGEPVAQLTGSREFWSREFAITPDVLIPRPETELLVELALELIPADQPWRILDLGTGSGAIGVTLAIERPAAQITALDICPAALDVARLNARRLGATNIRFTLSNWFGEMGATERFDIIVSNPPYIAESDIHLKQGDICFEPSLALASGPDGLDATRSIAKMCGQYLCAASWLLLEHGFDQGAEVRRILRLAGLSRISTHRDLLGHERVTVGSSSDTD